MAIPLPSNIHPAVAKAIDDRYAVETFGDINTKGPLYDGMLRYVRDQDAIYKRNMDGSWIPFGSASSESLWLVYAYDNTGTGATYRKDDDVTHYSIVGGKVKPLANIATDWISLSPSPLVSTHIVYIAYATSEDGDNFSLDRNTGTVYTHYGVYVGSEIPSAEDYVGNWIPLASTTSNAYKAYATNSNGNGATYIQQDGVTYTHYSILVGSTQPPAYTATEWIPFDLSAFAVTTWIAYADDAIGTNASFARGERQYVAYLFQATQPVLSEFADWLLIGGQVTTNPDGTNTWVAYASDSTGTSPSFTKGTNTYYSLLQKTEQPALSEFVDWLPVRGTSATQWTAYADTSTGSNPSFTRGSRTYIAFYFSDTEPLLTDFVDWIPLNSSGGNWGKAGYYSV